VRTIIDAVINQAHQKLGRERKFILASGANGTLAARPGQAFTFIFEPKGRRFFDQFIKIFKVNARKAKK
jgi:hypothetical protein